MKNETWAYYDPAIGRILAIGTKTEIRAYAEADFEYLIRALELREKIKKG